MAPADQNEAGGGGAALCGDDVFEKMVADCLSFAEDDKILQASRLEKRVEREAPHVHARHLAALEKVRAEAKVVEFGEKFLTDEAGWTCVREGKHTGDVRVWHRPEEGSDIHALKVMADVDAPLEYMLVLVNEVTLFAEWLPFMGAADLLARPSRCTRVAWWRMWSPAALVIHHRDACIRGRAIDGLDEDDCVLILIQDSDETRDAVPHPALLPRTTRIAITHATVKLEPLPGGGTRVIAGGAVDPFIKRMPPWLINWIATKVCYVGMLMWERKAKIVAEGKDKKCAHRARMEQDKDFYDWVKKRVASWVPGRHHAGKSGHASESGHVSTHEASQDAGREDGRDGRVPI
mmetsp:Transcript_21105/g.50103  ORF Transcript_21105/g.50103 Transcript_21105/m.50103 type:complete len:349 (+) Transcript_21105:2-1048(+)|eukprot:CAMPEP_0180268610 /NCGR_PEP_ID=MMETSP0988-20121125/2203_1 /TAXON_ID=697907 /ORGANISM="non described non described, Strain CCMP2293" /LENGTH=348 /DNA_ID=CAMNT_0022239425 /DNA_START=1 /DNA_END=1047 /DNA_ORIENTATION=-